MDFARSKMVFLLITKCSSNLSRFGTPLFPPLPSASSPGHGVYECVTCIASGLPSRPDASRYRSKCRIHFGHSFAVHCPRSPVGAQLLANNHDASRWLVIAKAIAGLNITTGVASQRILTRRILYCPTLKMGNIEFARLECYADPIHSAIVNPAG